MKISVVYFPEKEKAALKTSELNTALAPDGVLVKADYDLISAGTELANYHDLPNTSVESDVPENHFPKYTGYSVSGHVVEVGPGVKTVKPGDAVVVPWSGHCSWFNKPEATLFRLPDGMDRKAAAFTHLSSFPLLAVRKLQIQLGESVMVAGLGLLGLFALQFAKRSGAYPVLACDLSAERRALALKLGADYALDPLAPDFINQVKTLTDGKGADAVVEVTGVLAGLQQALEYVAFMGRIAILGCTRISDQPINIYRYIHGRGIQIIGAHTISRPQKESRPGAWTEKDDYATFVKLLQAKAVQAAPLISRIVSPHDCEEVYHTLGFEKDPPLGILFDWTQVDPEKKSQNN